MSSKKDPKFLQFIAFYCNVAQKVVREFTTFSILKCAYKDWEDFLSRNIHIIFHLWINDTNCCQCSSESSNVFYRKPILYPKQINLLFRTDGKEKYNHCVRNGGHIKQHCVCKLSVNRTCTIESIDVPLLVSLLRNCEGTKVDYQKYKKSFEAILKFRNHIFHTPDTRLDDQTYDELWKELTTAVIEISENTSENPDDSVELVKREIYECQKQRGSSEQIHKVSIYCIRFLNYACPAC